MGLKHRDLENTVLSRLSIDEYQSKTGENADVVVVGFRVMGQAAGKDLYSFLNSSTVEVRDVEVSPNPDLDNYYMVFIEIDRKPGCLNDIHALLQDVEHVSGPLKWHASTHLTDDQLDVYSNEFKKYFIQKPSDYRSRTEYDSEMQEQLQEDPAQDKDLNIGDQVEIIDGPLVDLLPNTEGEIVGFDTEGDTDYAFLSFPGQKPADYVPVETEFLMPATDQELLPENHSTESCPAPTHDLELNTKNRDSAIQADHIKYGPLNVDEPGDYWEDIADYWDTTVKAAKKSLCGNCVAFDISPRMLECMPGETSDEDGELGYCWMHHFKCHSARSCRTWAKGGPITEDEVSLDWQSRNPIDESNSMQELVHDFLNYSDASVESVNENVITLRRGQAVATLQVLACGPEQQTLAEHALSEAAVNHGDSRMKTLNRMLGEARAVWIHDNIVIYHANHHHMLVTKPC